MRKARMAATALSAALLCASGASAQIAMGVRVSADRLPMAGEDASSYWGIGGGAANAARGGKGDGEAKPNDKPHVDDARK